MQLSEVKVRLISLFVTLGALVALVLYGKDLGAAQLALAADDTTELTPAAN